MKTTTFVMLGLLTAFVLAAGPAAANGNEPAAPEASACEPVWIDSDNKVRYDPDCIHIPPGPVLDNSP